MSDTSERFRKVADEFSDRVKAVAADGWDQQSPCPDWVARDVVMHVVQTTGMFLERADVKLPPAAQGDDPVAAWEAARGAVQKALDDPAIASREYESPMGTTTLEETIGKFGIGDVLVHTWDLARATGLDERLDHDEVKRLFAVMEPNDEMMRKGTAFGPKVGVSYDADDQTKLLAFTGRHV